MTGMFVATQQPAGCRTRIRVEVIDRDRGFMVEGVVAHARKMRGEMTRVTQSGHGSALPLRGGPGAGADPRRVRVTEEIPQDPARPLARSRPEPTLPPGGARPRRRPIPRPTRRPASGAAGPLPSVRRRSRRSRHRAGAAATSRPLPQSGEFLDVYRRDILQGGLFVSTRYPGPPAGDGQRGAPSAPSRPPSPSWCGRGSSSASIPCGDPHSPNLLAGMGLELIDLPALVEKLQPVVRRMQG